MTSLFYFELPFATVIGGKAQWGIATYGIEDFGEDVATIGIVVERIGFGVEETAFSKEAISDETNRVTRDVGCVDGCETNDKREYLNFK